MGVWISQASRHQFQEVLVRECGSAAEGVRLGIQTEQAWQAQSQAYEGLRRCQESLCAGLDGVGDIKSAEIPQEVSWLLLHAQSRLHCSTEPVRQAGIDVPNRRAGPPVLRRGRQMVGPV